MTEYIKCATIQFVTPGPQDPQEPSSNRRFFDVKKGDTILVDRAAALDWVGGRHNGTMTWRAAPYSTVISENSGPPTGFEPPATKPLEKLAAKHDHAPPPPKAPEAPKISPETVAGHSSKKPDLDAMIKAAAEGAQPGA